ncbi:hypothetical protein [Streptomyces massasporeus]
MDLHHAAHEAAGTTTTELPLVVIALHDRTTGMRPGKTCRLLLTDDRGP